ncbi:MAG: hypothetical protein JXR95_14920 [Deltaproteobacteria bacterium]|nr:hypothetical protein [Deltaproteobacteria bacterium]
MKEWVLVPEAVENPFVVERLDDGSGDLLGELFSPRLLGLLALMKAGESVCGRYHHDFALILHFVQGNSQFKP